MAKVLGLGGVFFKSDDPAALRAWYARWLGMYADDYGVNFHPDTMPDGAYTAWAPFPRDTEHFEPSRSSFMLNLIVDDLDEALDQVEQGGAQVMEDIEETELGRFGWFVDPDGHKVELWQPAAP
jgi:predicted enzyme related to lactoylglutathione lyase